jgi:hypothetical protein
VDTAPGTESIAGVNPVQLVFSVGENMMRSLYTGSFEFLVGVALASGLVASIYVLGFSLAPYMQH